jgi:hypothetical protein
MRASLRGRGLAGAARSLMHAKNTHGSAAAPLVGGKVTDAAREQGKGSKKLAPSFPSSGPVAARGLAQKVRAGAAPAAAPSKEGKLTEEQVRRWNGCVSHEC